jgi:dihydroorotase (multifunctional complex type)
VEAEAISRIILFAREVGNRVHIAHMSTREGVDLVKKAKLAGQAVTAEVCPHHLLLNKNDYQKFGPKVVLNPPLRSKSDNEALWRALADGTVDTLATDHAAVSMKEKEVGLRNIWDTPPGIPGLETSASLLLSEGVNKKRITLERFVSFTSENPAKIFGIYPRKGALSVGSDADITVIDLKKEHTIKADQLKCVGDFTPFENWKLRGKPVLTIVRGKVVAREGEIIAKPGYGRFIHSNTNVKKL